jgi:tRNA (guanine37-N1)-methyltransferase
MKIDILTLFPEMFCGPFDNSIVKRAQEKKLIEIKIHNLRNYTDDKHKTVDDHPFGGGAGMVLKIEPVDKALKDLKKENSKVILTTPQGKVFDQAKAKDLAAKPHLIIVCGHYEGVDERIRTHLVDEEISIGDYVLTGGELPAMVITDAVTRLITGVLKKEEATRLESFSKYKIADQERILLEYPQYTRPENYHEWKVPEVLLSGNHTKIEEWRQEEALKRTKERRPDLLTD